MHHHISTQTKFNRMEAESENYANQADEETRSHASAHNGANYATIDSSLLDTADNDNRSQVSHLREYFRNYLLVIELVACAALGFTGHFLPEYLFRMKVHDREIPYQITGNGDIIYNQYINNALVGQQTIPDWLLVVLTMMLPLIIVIIVGLKSRIKYDLHSVVCALFFTVGLTQFITDFVKIYCGYFRPNFYEYCQFSNDDMACDSDRNNPRKSFPSGHASSSFSSMTFLALYFAGKIGLHCSCNENMKMILQKRFFTILAFTPMFLAVFIASSRVHDDMHHPADVVGGSLIGIICAILGYSLWYNSIYSARAGYPLVSTSQ